MGKLGYRERVDFGELVGFHVEKVEKTGERIKEPTTVGIFHYKADGYFHVVPARPNNK